MVASNRNCTASAPSVLIKRMQAVAWQREKVLEILSKKWLKEEKITYREDLVEGLENTLESFIGLLQGKNFGKLVMRVGPDEL